MKIKQSAPLLLLSGFLAVASFPLLAAASEDLNRLLIVTEVATKTPQTLAQLAPSVDTLSAGELKTRQLHSVNEALSYLPGTTLIQTGQTGSQTSLFIRGMESNHTVALLNGRRLAPGLAGLYQLEQIDATFLEGIDLVRGPVSTLYGSDAIAGALNLRMADARKLPQGATFSTFAEGGSFRTARAGQQVMIREGKLGAVVDAGYLTTENDLPENDFRNLSLRGNLAYELGEGVYLDVLGYYQDSRLQVPGPTHSPLFPEPQLNDSTTWLASPRLTIERDGWDFQLYYSRNESELEATRDVFLQDNLLDQASDEAEARVNLKPSKDTTLTLGTAWYSYEFTRTPLVPGAFNTPAGFDYAYWSTFAQIDTKLPAELRLIAGARWDEHDSFESKGTWSVALSRDFEATHTQLFGKVATGYKAPSGQDFVFLDPSVEVSLIDPEESLSWEAGIRQHLPQDFGSLSAVFFHNDITNLVDSVGYPAFPTIVDTETQGVELGLDLHPAQGLTVYTHYTWLDTEIQDGLYFGGYAGGPGDRLPRRPTHSLSAGFCYRTPDWKFGAEVTSAFDRYDSPGVFLDDYAVARAYGSVYVGEQVEFFGRVENVFDADYEYTLGYPATGLGFFGGIRVTF